MYLSAVANFKVDETEIYTERQKKHHFFRVTLTKIHRIKMNHIWTQIIRIRRDSIIYEVKTIRPLSLPVPIPAQRARKPSQMQQKPTAPTCLPLRAPPASTLTPSRSSSPYHKSTPNKYKRGVGKEGGNKKRTDGFYFVDNRITPDSYNLHL